MNSVSNHARPGGVWCQRVSTYAQAVPGTLDVAPDPLLDCFDVLLAVLELLPDLGLVAVQDVDAGLLARLGVEDAPASVCHNDRRQYNRSSIHPSDVAGGGGGGDGDLRCNPALRFPGSA